MQPVLYISEPSEKQELHSWYARLASTTFKGKMLVMYVHQPSLLLILTRGKTVTGTMPQFIERLEALMDRINFEPEFITKEMEMIRQGFVISKTNSRSMLGNMNAIAENIEYRCSRFVEERLIDLDLLENDFLKWLVRDSQKGHQYRTPLDYWKEKKLIE